MKQIIKHSKKGFTLVETMLSVFILVVISTMLVNGFITTMGYSYQTAIYSKSAAMNYSACMSRNGSWNRQSNFLDGGREEYMYNNGGNLIKKELKFSPGSIYSSCEPLSVAIEKHDTLDGVVPGSLPYMDPRYAPNSDTNDSYVDNRTTFFYYPEYYSEEGDIIVMMDTTGTTTKYYWVEVDKTAHASAYVYDDELGKYKLNRSYNLASLSGNTIAEIG